MKVKDIHNIIMSNKLTGFTGLLKRSLSGRVKLSIVNCQLSILLSLLAAFTSCERREMYVYGEEFQSVEMDVNWRKYAETDPDGMTVWFYPLGSELQKPYRTTTANVRTPSLYLPGGSYRGVVVDYSPEEFSRQRFVGLDSLSSVRVEATPSAYQPDSLTVAGEGVPAGLSESVNSELFGEAAWPGRYADRPSLQANGLLTVANQPEEMALDTLFNVVVKKGEYGDYIPWKERGSYQEKIEILTIHSEPESIIWKIRIRIYIRSGFNSLWQQPASIAGLSDGHYLAGDNNTDTPCLMSIDDWELERAGEDSGYIQTTLNTFGLCPSSIKGGTPHHVSSAGLTGAVWQTVSGIDNLERSSMFNVHISEQREQSQACLNFAERDEIGRSQCSMFNVQRSTSTRAGETEPQADPPGWYNYITDLCEPEAIRLNLAFTLRDHATTVFYHFDVGRALVEYEEQEVLRIDLGSEFFEQEGIAPIDLPYVDAFNGAGFDAHVTDWQEGGTADTTM